MEKIYDVIVIGGGPAGLSAALYLARAKYHVLVLEKDTFGGQITITSEIVNYPGVEKTSGRELTDTMKLQAEDFGAEFTLAEVTDMDFAQDIKCITDANGKQYKAFGILLALGASPRQIGFPGEKEFQGRGVAYCATCDGEFFAGRDIFVIGGGFAAVEEAMFLTKYANKVTIVVREEGFTCAAGVYERLKNYPDIEVRFRTEIKEAGGEGTVSWVKLQENTTGKITQYCAADGGPIGVFVFAGYEPATKGMEGKILLNEQGYIVTDQEQKTSIPGVYAAGDVCIKRLRQVVTAVSDGAIAATSLEKHVSETRKRLGIEKPEIIFQNAAERREKRLAQKEQEKSGDREDFSEGFLSEKMKNQLKEIFSKFQRKITIKVMMCGDEAQEELKGFAEELKGIHEKLTVVQERRQGESKHSWIDICVEEKTLGIRYYSVPGGHEFNSFVIALYNAGGSGQKISESLVKRIKMLQKPHILKVMATLSCTNCPEVVMATQKIASLSPQVEAEMYDLSKFPELKEKYKIMAVPCLIIDEKQTYFGKRNLDNIMELLENT